MWSMYSNSYFCQKRSKKIILPWALFCCQQRPRPHLSFRVTDLFAVMFWWSIPRYYEGTSSFVIPPLLWPWSSLSKDKISDLIVVLFLWSQYSKVRMDILISNAIWSYSFCQYCPRHNKVDLTFCWRCIPYDPTQAVSILWPFISRPWLGWQANGN